MPDPAVAQGPEEVAVGQAHHGRVVGTEQVLVAEPVATGARARPGVDARHDGGAQHDIGRVAAVERAGQPARIGQHAAAHDQHGLVPPDLGRLHVAQHALHGRKALVGLHRAENVRGQREAVGVGIGLQRLAVVFVHIAVHERHAAAERGVDVAQCRVRRVQHMVAHANAGERRDAHHGLGRAGIRRALHMAVAGPEGGGRVERVRVGVGQLLGKGGVVRAKGRVREMVREEAAQLHVAQLAVLRQRVRQAPPGGRGFRSERLNGQREAGEDLHKRQVHRPAQHADGAERLHAAGRCKAVGKGLVRGRREDQPAQQRLEGGGEQGRVDFRHGVARELAQQMGEMGGARRLLSHGKAPLGIWHGWGCEEVEQQVGQGQAVSRGHGANHAIRRERAIGRGLDKPDIARLIDAEIEQAVIAAAQRGEGLARGALQGRHHRVVLVHDPGAVRRLGHELQAAIRGGRDLLGLGAHAVRERVFFGQQRMQFPVPLDHAAAHFAARRDVGLHQRVAEAVGQRQRGRELGVFGHEGQAVGIVGRDRLDDDGQGRDAVEAPARRDGAALRHAQPTRSRGRLGAGLVGAQAHHVRRVSDHGHVEPVEQGAPFRHAGHAEHLWQGGGEALAAQRGQRFGQGQGRRAADGVDAGPNPPRAVRCAVQRGEAEVIRQGALAAARV